jgi:7SK snRNA methylphosphate capping enzyme
MAKGETPSSAVEGRSGGVSKRRDQNRKKRLRKKKARMYCRTRSEGGTKHEQDEEDRPPLPQEHQAGDVVSFSSQLSSHMNYAGSLVLAQGESKIGDEDDQLGGDAFDYGVVKGKTKGNVFIYGNYDRYYGYRIMGDPSCSSCSSSHSMHANKSTPEEDPRIGRLEKGWFHNKRCLDVGCNEGILTLSLVKTFRTASMTAIDLDEHLVKRACVNLRKERSAAVNEYVLSQQASAGPQKRKQAKQTMQSLAQTWFVHGNIMASKVEKGSFDCITALSVTKWIHLHSGDGGIRYFFGKVRDLLAPGGKFILEPQTWKSYKHAAAKMKRGRLDTSVLDTAYFFRLDELKLRPEQFSAVLTGEYGLRLIKTLRAPEGTASGFDRTIFVYAKM